MLRLLIETCVHRRTAALFQKSMDALTIRLKAGDVAAVDVSRMNVDALRARNDARSAQAEVEKSQSTLAYLIGADREAARLRAADAWPALEKLVLQTADALIEGRPDVQAALARVAAAGKSRDLARALRTRDITAGVQVERFPGNDPRNSAGLSVSVPLFTRYYYDGEIRRAESDFDAAQDNLQRLRALPPRKSAKQRAMFHPRPSACSACATCCSPLPKKQRRARSSLTAAAPSA